MGWCHQGKLLPAIRFLVSFLDAGEMPVVLFSLPSGTEHGMPWGCPRGPFTSDSEMTVPSTHTPGALENLPPGLPTVQLLLLLCPLDLHGRPLSHAVVGDRAAAHG